MKNRYLYQGWAGNTYSHKCKNTNTNTSTDTNEKDDNVLSRNDVNFFDYDGTLLYAYTWEEAKNLTALPKLPVHEGLEVREWNYTLEDIKAQGTETNIGKADVGACVYNSNGDQVCALGVFIFERGIDNNINNNDTLNQVPAWVISIPNTVTKLWRGFMYGAACFNELKVPISVTEIDNVYGGAFESSIMESPVWWNGDNRTYNITASYGMSMKIPKNFTNVSINTYYINKTILHENVEYIDDMSYTHSATLLDFTRATFVPTLRGFIGSNYPYFIVVPDALYEEWINTTNWSDGADKIYKHSMLPWLK